MPGQDPARDNAGYYFPDVVVDAFVTQEKDGGAAEPAAMPPTGTAAGRRFSVDESKALIVAALNGFDAEMGLRAQEILATAQVRDTGVAVTAFNVAADDNPFLKSDYRLDVAEGSRWNISLVEPGQARLMRCLPADSPQREVVPGYFDPANPHSHAVIELHFDGTMNGVAYMAHELGHAMADDCQREAGNSFRDNPAHLAETQAYLVQHIVYDALRRHSDPGVAQAAQAHYAATMEENRAGLSDVTVLHGRPMSLFSARALAVQLQEQDDNTRNRAAMMLMGREGRVDIGDVFMAAGVETPEALARLARTALQVMPPEESAAMIAAGGPKQNSVHL